MQYIKIGNVNIEKSLALAPMAGVADRAYRIMCKKFGCSYVVSEMVSAKGLCYNDAKTKELCTVTDIERPMAIQLFGSEPEFMSRAVEIVNDFKPDIIDINMGCPVPKVVNIGCGSALMKDIKTAFAVAESAVRVSKSPVTVKFRSGWDNDSINAVEFAKAVESAGVSAIAVHGRTREQFYSGNADWNIISEVKQNVSIPVIGNGDVVDFKSCMDMYDSTGCDLVMTGRGSYGNPFIFDEIRYGLNNKEYTYPDAEKKMKIMLEHIRLILDLSEKPENIAIREARKISAWYMNGCYGSAKFRAKCYTLDSFEQAEKLAEEFVEVQKSHISF
ncbi:MAG: tRNA dihydrouridine synthase DusB [Oscillospiraceae bacterium]|nr:tRNA dihydrouridine synthase DusB [Oscillospiraceae bacterium]